MTGEHTVFKRLPWRAADLHALVSDVRRYPDFVKYITALRVRDEVVDGAVTTCLAEARIRYKFVGERFSTRVRSDRAQATIDVSYESGPFRTLENRWRFHPLSDGSTLVEFWIRYEFKNPLLQSLLDANRDRAVRALMASFEAEAQRRYALSAPTEPSGVGEEIDALIEQRQSA